MKKKPTETELEKVIHRLARKRRTVKQYDYDEHLRESQRLNDQRQRLYFIKKAMSADFTKPQAKFMYENLAGVHHEHSRWHA